MEMTIDVQDPKAFAEWCNFIGAIPKADYENRLKADMVAMLTEIQLEIEEEAFDMTGLVYIPNTDNVNVVLMDDLNKIIQQKINSLKEG